MSNPSSNETEVRPAVARACAGRTVVGLSGGVDSAFCLYELDRRGVPVAPVFMKNWEEDDTDGYCSAERDLADARSVCERLGLELSTVNLSFEYWEHVFEAFLAEVERGRTPNPDVLCNRAVKFRAFLDFALDRGATGIATGHYARRRETGGRVHLLKGVDAGKDQSYFLHRLDQSQLARACFPIGGLDKTEVRRRAAAAGLPVSGKKDSTGICFIGERRFDAFLARYVSARPGPIVSVDGTLLGEHRGLAFYTIGQRQGLGIGGRTYGSGQPWYVAAKRIGDDALVVAQGRTHPALHARALVASDAHWIAGEPPSQQLDCAAKIRHRQPDQPCRVTVLDGGRIEVRFREPQWAVAPGQAVVLYAGDECLGGAVIDAAIGQERGS